MTREQFDQLVRRLDARHARHPWMIRLSCLAWMLLGLAFLAVYLLAVPAAGIALLVGGLVSKLTDGGWVMLGLGAVLLVLGIIGLVRTLWARMPLPDGHELKAEDAPALFADIESLRRSLRALPFHRVLLTHELNASVSERPLLGVFGWHRHYLRLGLPLMESLTVEQCRAVIAHECAHLSARHGRFGALIYRLRRAWGKVYEQHCGDENAEASSLRSLVNRFVRWFWPRFHARAFVLSRANEFHADHEASRLTSPRAISEGLLRMDMASCVLREHFWKRLWERAADEPKSPADIMGSLASTLHEDRPTVEFNKWFTEVVRVPTTNDDTHPCLSERAAALQCQLVSALPLGEFESAAHHYFGPSLSAMQQVADKLWWEDSKAAWTERHERAQALRHRLDRIEQRRLQRGADAAHDADDLWSIACATANLRGRDAATPLFAQVLAVRPNHAGANFQLGCSLLDKHDAQGIGYIEEAMKLAPNLVADGCEALRAHFIQMGDLEQARNLALRLDALEQGPAAPATRLRAVNSSGDLQSHALPADQQYALTNTLRREALEVVAAWLARQPGGDADAQDTFLLCISTRRSRWWNPGAREKERLIARKLFHYLHLPGKVLIFGPSGERKALARRVMAMAGAQVLG